MSTLHLHSCLHCAPCQRAKRINPGKLIEWPSRTKRQRPKLLKRRPSRWQAWSGISRTSWVEVSKRLQYVLWDDATHQYKSWAIPIDYLFTALYYINLRSFLPQLLKQLHWLCSRFNLYSCRKWQLLWWSHGSAEKGPERPLQETGATAGNMILHECCSELNVHTSTKNALCICWSSILKIMKSCKMNTILQIAAGAGAGWVTGYLTMKVGRVEIKIPKKVCTKFLTVLSSEG